MQSLAYLQWRPCESTFPSLSRSTLSQTENITTAFSGKMRMKVLLRALGVTLPKWYQGLDSWQTETVSTKFISQQGRAVPVGPSLVTGSSLSNSSVLAHPSGPQPPHNDVRCLYTMGQTVSDMNAASNLCTSLCLGADGVRKARLTFLMTADFMTPPSFHPQH